MAEENKLVKQLNEEIEENAYSNPIIKTVDANVFYGDMHAIKNVNIDIKRIHIQMQHGPGPRQILSKLADN